jgi:hypothetical protein
MMSIVTKGYDSGPDSPIAYGFGVISGNPHLTKVLAIDARHVRVRFSEIVNTDDALVASNYVITGGGGLAVLAVELETESTYILTTEFQTIGVTYTLTVENIRDLEGNPT